MNLRQKKKHIKKALNRHKQLNHYHFKFGRQNGKTEILIKMFKAMNSKKYKPFNDILKWLNSQCVK